MSESSPWKEESSEPSYKIAGGGRDAFSKIQIRDQIRRGEITAQTEIARGDNEEYHPASSYAELARYFALAAPPPTERKAATSGPRPSTITRVLPGLIYPFTGVGWILILASTLLKTLPFGEFVAGVFMTVYGLAVIRRSAEGSKAMPMLTDVGDPVTFIMSFLKYVAVTIVSAIPLIVVLIVTRSVMLGAAVVLVMILYYPAAIATLAKWNNLVLALTPSAVFRFMGVLGADYVLALIALIFAGVIAIVAALGASMFMGPHGRDVVSGFLGAWMTMYFFHLLGWGIYHHEEEF